MELLHSFKKYLFSQKKSPSKATVKNYVADIRHFIIWFENQYHCLFQPKEITPFHEKEFIKAKQDILSQASINRHLSSLRKFFLFLLETNEIKINPFVINSIQIEQEIKDPWKIIGFKEILKRNKVSKVTIKNYVSDIQQFFLWIEKNKNKETSDTKEILQFLNVYFIEQYKSTLEKEQRFSQSSIKRKVSSIKRYISWITPPEEIAKATDLIQKADKQIQETKNVEKIICAVEKQEASINQATIFENGIEKVDEEILSKKTKINYSFLEDAQEKKYYFYELKNKENFLKKKNVKKRDYSKIPPIRVFQKIIAASNFMIDFLLVLPIKWSLEKTDYAIWSAKGKPIFSKKKKIFENIKTFANQKIQASYESNKNNFLFRKKQIRQSLFHGIVPKHFFTQLKHRPAWYHNYHRYPITHYFHFAILVIFMSAVSFSLYLNFFDTQRTRPVFASLPTAPPKILSFHGQLSDKNHLPITTRTNVRFAVYTNSIASGSALLWQEVDAVHPDGNGNVSLSLGNKSFFDPNIFSKNPNIWLGVTVEQADEFRPRQQLATTSYAANTQTLQGMSPITEADSGTKNVILALDSGGNLTMNDSDTHTFQATNGQFILSGNTIIIGTNPGSSSDVKIAPDGLGKIDMQKPLQNTSNYNNIPSALGSVEVDDTFSILATSSGQSAFTINQNGYGPLISASSAGVAKFTIDTDGSITSAGDLSIKGNIKSSLLPSGINLDLGSNKSQWNSLFAKNIYLDGNPLSQVWQENNDSILPINQSKNLLIGLTASTSANFSIIASTGAIFTKSNISLIGTAPIISTVNNQTLQLGNATTGSVLISPNNQTGIFVNQHANVGIGTKILLDETALHIQKNSATDALLVADQLGTGNIFTGKANGANKFAISNNGDTRITGGGLCISSNSNCANKVLSPGTFYGDEIHVPNADLAENYISAEQLEPGDIIMPESNGNNVAVIKSTSQYQPQIIGVVSTKPGLTLNSDAQTDATHPYKYPIAISGRVPVKVSIANGVIRTGDLLTSSPISGIAMKATKAGAIVGKALEDFSSETPGKVMTYMSVSFADPTILIAENGNLNSANDSILSQNSNQNNFAVDVINKIANQAQIIFRNVSANLISAKEIAVDTITINKRLVSPISDIQTIHSNLIAPLSETARIALQFHDTDITITNGTNSAVAIFDNQGNASLSGTIASNNLQVAHDATISGVLHVSKLIADQIEGPTNATQSSQYITNITNMYTATPAAQTIPHDTQTLALGNNTQTASTSGNIDMSKNIAKNAFIDIDKYADQFSNVPSLHINTATIEQGLVSMGPTSLADTSITGQLSIGSQFVFTNNSINVLGGDLELQPLKQGGIAIAGRQLYIDNNGNITANGNATFNGVLAANIIAPIPNNDLTIKLDAGQQSTHAPKLNVTNASNSAVFSVSQIGDIIASGAATLNKLNFTIAKTALALSENEIMTSGSAGVATISASQTFVKIDNTSITDKSLIYITPVGASKNSPFLLQQVPKKSFTVGIEQSSQDPSTFNWLIIN